MSFFIPDRKRKRSRPESESKAKRRKGSEDAEDEKVSDEEIISSSDEGEQVDIFTNTTAKPEAAESADEKRLRLAKQMLQKIRKPTDDSDEELDDDAVQQKLREEAWAARHGVKKGFRRVAEKLIEANVDPTKLEVRFLRGHKLPVTAVRITEDERYVFSASKDCTIIKWDVETGQKVATIKGGRNIPELGGHTDEILALALSSDGKFLASGGHDKVIRIWDASTCTFVDSFKGHKDAVSALTFRVGSHDLYSAGFDRQVKVWDCTERMYVDTLYGHQQEIFSMDSLTRETCVTSSADKQARIWKFTTRTCLIFKGPKTSLECVSLLNEDRFVTGGQNGEIQLWNSMKKKPEVVYPNAHSLSDNGNSDNALFRSQAPLSWISSISALRYSDIFATGSATGSIKIWRTEEGWKGISPILEIPKAGFINSLHFSSSGRFLIAGVGQEHRLGRWTRLPSAKNGVCIIQLPLGK